MTKFETKNQKYLNYHLAFNTFLVYANPLLHIFTVAENPCTPNFISSLFFNCENSFEKTASLKDKTFFLIFEYYNIAKWQYAVSFMWCCLYMGIDIVHVELQKLSRNIKKNCNSDNICHKLKRCELVVHFLNHTLRYYMGIVVNCTIFSMGTRSWWRCGVIWHQHVGIAFYLSTFPRSP